MGEGYTECVEEEGLYVLGQKSPSLSNVLGLAPETLSHFPGTIFEQSAIFPGTFYMEQLLTAPLP